MLRAAAGEDGATAVIAAVLLSLLLGMAALAVDVGSLQWTKRRLQAATDAAALAATYALSTGTAAPDPQSWADSYLSRNGFAGALAAVPELGIQCPDASLAVSARFTPTTDPAASCAGHPEFGTGPNAVRVTTRVQSPLYLGRLLLPGQSSVPVAATATAAQIPQAGFYAGTGLLALDGGMINAVLGALLGSNLTLDLASYNGILNANFSALSFFQALATNLGVTAGTYGSLLQSDATVQQVLQAEIDALNTMGGVTDVSAAVAGLTQLRDQITGSPTLRLADLFDLGVWNDLGLGSGEAPPALSATLNAFQLASLAAQVANGAHAVAIPGATLGIPGIATLTAATTVIEPPVGPPFAFGPVGVQVHTAQVRLQLNLQLLSALSLGGLLGAAPVNVPIYIEVADGEAKLTGIACGLNPATDAEVTIAAQPAAVRAFIGTVDASGFDNFSVRPDVYPASLVNLLGVLSITGSAETDLGSGTPTSLTFTQADIAAHTAQRVASTGMLANLLQVLGSRLVLTVQPLNVTTQPLTASLTTLLQPVFAGLDPLVDGLLAALGIQLGYIDVTATGVRCGAPVLVD